FHVEPGSARSAVPADRRRPGGPAVEQLARRAVERAGALRQHATGDFLGEPQPGELERHDHHSLGALANVARGLFLIRHLTDERQHHRVGRRPNRPGTATDNDRSQLSGYKSNRISWLAESSKSS